jgi:hypothetical protein
VSRRQVFRISDLSGGLNQDQNEVLIADNEASEILNFRLDRLGSLVSRRGYSKYISSSYSTAEFQSIGRWSDGAGVFKILGKAGTSIVEVATSYPSLATGLNAAAEGVFLPAQNYLVYANGVNAPLAYNGTSMVPLGITPPAAAPVAATGSGSLTGTFQYVYTYFSSTTGWESNPSSPSSPLTLAAQGADLTLVAATHPFANSIRIYRSFGGGTFLLLATISGSLTTYNDSGAATPVAIAVSTNNNVPLNLENLAYHKGYLFGSIGDTIYWSRPLRINAFPTLQNAQVPFEGNDRIVALRSFQDTLIIFGERNTIVLAGDGGQWALIRQDVEIGCLSRKAIVEAEGALLFLSPNGIRAFPGFQQYAPKITRTIDSLPVSARKQAAMAYVPEERVIWLSLADLTWGVHVVNQAVTLYNIPAHFILPGGKDGNSFPLFLKDDTSLTPEGQVWEYGALTDDGDPLILKWRSKVFQVGNPEFVKFFRRIGAYATSGGTSGVTVILSDTKNSYSIPLESVGELVVSSWDTFNWALDTGPSTSVWSSEGSTYFIGTLPAQSLLGRTMQVILEASATTRLEILPPISLEYRESDRFIGAP